MNKVAKFEKVSFEQFLEDVCKTMPQYQDDEEYVRHIYDNIKLPKRATVGSAGYDFFTPFGFTIGNGKTTLIPSGIRCKIEEGWVLSIYPRSGLGFKHRIQLDNTVGIIDSDYYNSSNEGHIMIKVSCDSYKEDLINIDRGQGLVQGIFLPFGVTEDDEVTATRDGGFGSTDGK